MGRNGKTLALMLALIIAISCLALLAVEPANAQYLGQVVINANSTIEPATAPMQRNGETYILSDDVGKIIIRRSNIVLDGNGSMLPGKVSFVDSLGNNVTANNAGGVFLDTVDKVTVKNLLIKDAQTGIFLERSTNCVITNNTIIGTHAIVPGLQATAAVYVWGGNNSVITENNLHDNYNGLYLGYDSQTTIIKNKITNSTYAVVAVWNSSNILYCNNFIHNAEQVAIVDSSINIWDNGEGGNYWSDYNGSGVYVIDENNIDRYPLTSPVDIYEESIPTPSPTTDRNAPPHLDPFYYLIFVGIIVAVVVLLVLLYQSNRKTALSRTLRKSLLSPCFFAEDNLTV